MALGDYLEALQDAELSELSWWPYWLKVMGSLLLGLAMLLAGYILFYAPQQARLKSAEKQQIQLKEGFKNKQQLAATLPAYQQQMLEIQDRFEVLLKQLPNQTEVPALLTDISQAGKERGLEFKRFKPLETAQKDFYVTLPIEIEASGTYHQLASFVSDIVNFERVVTVGDVDMQRTKFKQDTGVASEDIPLTFKAKLHTYHYKALEQQRKAGVAQK